MEISADSNNLYYNFNNSVKSVDTSNEVTPSTNSQEASFEAQNSASTQKNFNELPKEEVIALYFNRQATQLTQDIIDIYAANSEQTDYTQESTDVSLQDINSLQKQLNRGEVLEDIASVPQSERADIDPNEIAQSLKENIENNTDNREVSQEEAVALYYNYQANQLTKDIIDIYAANSESIDYTQESTEVSLTDINALQKQLNRGEVLEDISSTPQNERPQKAPEVLDETSTAS